MRTGGALNRNPDQSLLTLESSDGVGCGLVAARWERCLKQSGCFLVGCPLIGQALERVGRGEVVDSMRATRLLHLGEEGTCDSDFSLASA